MIDIKKAEDEFKLYVSKFDTNNSNIERKTLHSFRVEEICRKIAKELKLREEQIELATLIGLLHDIGRFEQYTKYQTFSDYKSIDHGQLGIEILEENKYIRKYIEDNKFDKIIEKAIYNHNKYLLQDNLNDEEKLFSKIIRDSDKLDICKEAIEIFWSDKEKKIETQGISKEVISQFKNKELIEHKFKNGIVDDIVGIISYIYDFNFKESYIFLKEENYINKLIDRFKFREDVAIEMEELRKIANEYIEEKTK